MANPPVSIVLHYETGQIVIRSRDGKLTREGKVKAGAKLLYAVLPGPAGTEDLLEVSGREARAASRLVGPWHVMPPEKSDDAIDASIEGTRIAVWIRVPCVLLSLQVSSQGRHRKADGDYVWVAARYEAVKDALVLRSLGMAAGNDTQAALWAKRARRWPRLQKEDEREPTPDLSDALSFQPVAKHLAIGVPNLPRDFLSSALERDLGLEPLHKPDYTLPGDALQVRWTPANQRGRTLLFTREFVADSSPIAALNGIGAVTAEQSFSQAACLLKLRAKGPAAGAMCRQSWEGLAGAVDAAARGERSFLFSLDFTASPPAEATLVMDLEAVSDVPDAYSYRLHPPKWDSLPAKLIFPSLQTHDRKPLELHAKVASAIIPPQAGRGEHLRLTILPLVKDGNPQPVRMGSLDLTISGLGNDPDKPGHCSLDYSYPSHGKVVPGEILQPRFKRFCLGPEEFETSSEDLRAGRVGATATQGKDTTKKENDQQGKADFPLILRVEKAVPGGLDRAREDVEVGNQNEPPILIPIGAADNQEPMRLVVAQTFGQANRPDLRLSLQPQSSQLIRRHEPLRVVYLDRTPLFVSLIRTNDLSDFKREEGAGEFAYWASEGITAGWNLRSSAERMELILTTQGIGETAEKFHAGEGMEDIAEEKLADYRFAPPTVLALKATDLPRSFAAAPWNIRHLLNSLRDTRLAGLTLEAARFELLYGMGMRFSKVPFLRLAEVFSRIGLPRERIFPVPPEEFGPRRMNAAILYAEVVDYWKQLLDVFAARLAVYEVFDDRQQEFAPDGRLSGLALTGKSGQPGLSAYLRKKASLKSSIPNPNLQRMPDDPNGIAGSFAWAFESRLIYEAVWNNSPHVDDEKVEAFESAVARLYFSALGGWGQQQASFDEGRSVIAARVEMGRVSELRIERLGRIANFWNRAKHVIVYRRSVLPSSQFEDQQDRLIGRAALRKYEEYIDFIQPYRPYPDAQTLGENAALPSCLAACSCSERILVDSRWGEDVYKDVNEAFGWKIPLRVPGARPDVYKQANLLLHFYADPNSGAGTVASRIVNLENVFFWTDVRPGKGNDSDAWDLVAGLDTGYFEDPAKGAQTEILDNFGANSVHPGSASVTYRLGALANQINLVGQTGAAAGTAEQIGSRLRNLTVSRGTFPSAGVNGRIEAYASQFENFIGYMEHLHDGMLGTGQKIEKARASMIATLKDGPNRLKEEVTKAIGGLQLPDAFEYARRVEQNLDFIYDRAKKPLSGLAGALQTRFPLLAKPLPATVEEARKEIGDVKDLLEKATEKYLSGIDGTIVQARGIVSEITAKSDELKRVIAAVETRVEEDVENAINGTNSALADLDQLVALLDRAEFRRLARIPYWQSLPLKIEYDVSEAIRKAIELREAVRQARAAYDARNGRLQALAGALKTRAAGALGTIASVIEQLQKALADFLNNLPSEFAGEVEGIRDKINEALAALKDGRNAAEEVWKEVRSRVSDLEQRATAVADDTKKKVRDAVQNFGAKVLADKNDLLNAATNTFETFRTTALDQWKTATSDILLAEQWLNDERQKLQTTVRRIRGAVSTVTGEVKNAAEDFRQAIEKGAKGITLYRGFGEVPSVPMMDFKGMNKAAQDLIDEVFKDQNEKTERFRSIAYTFVARQKDAAEKLLISPVTAMVDRTVLSARDAKAELEKDLRLKAQSIETQVRRVTDRIEADVKKLKEQTLDKIIPDLGSLKLEKLLGPVPIPSELAERIRQTVKLTHSFDRASMTAFADALIDNLEVGRDLVLFSFGPFALRLRRARLYAHTQIAASTDGFVQRQSDARLTADWEMAFSDSPLMTFKDAALRCTNGEIHMDLDPNKLELTSVLKAISDLTKNLSTGDDVFRAGVDVKLPTSITAFCRLNLAIPPVAGGTFAITNLRLGAYMNVGIALSGSPKFIIAIGLNLATPKAPFAIIVFILGGCGWFMLDALYEVPLASGSPRLVATVDVGIGAAAGLGINLGFLEGSVMISLSINAKAIITREEGTPSRTDWSIGFVLTFAGHVSVLGIVSVDLVISLSMTYESGGGLVGQGTVSIKIKICWCFTLSFERSFTYRFGKAGGGNASLDHQRHYVLEEPGPPSRRRRLTGRNSARAARAEPAASPQRLDQYPYFERAERMLN